MAASCSFVPSWFKKHRLRPALQGRPNTAAQTQPPNPRAHSAPLRVRPPNNSPRIHPAQPSPGDEVAGSKQIGPEGARSESAQPHLIALRALPLHNNQRINPAQASPGDKVAGSKQAEPEGASSERAQPVLIHRESQSDSRETAPKQHTPSLFPLRVPSCLRGSKNISLCG